MSYVCFGVTNLALIGQESARDTRRGYQTLMLADVFLAS